MNKTELIAAMAEASGLAKRDWEAALAAFSTTTESALKAGNKVQLVGFGSFEVTCVPKQERLSKTPSSNLKTHREALTVLIRKCFFF